MSNQRKILLEFTIDWEDYDDVTDELVIEDAGIVNNLKDGVSYKIISHKGNYRVNVLYRGKERWKYCRTIERARILQREAKKAGICAIIYQKIDGIYQSIKNKP